MPMDDCERRDVFDMVGSKGWPGDTGVIDGASIGGYRRGRCAGRHKADALGETVRSPVRLGTGRAACGGAIRIRSW
jgi:hypothetical protein